MKITSYEQLKGIQQEQAELVKRRLSGEASGDEVEILVGLATCGIAAGARETWQALTDLLAAKKLHQVRLVPVGCIGMCHSEPTIQINQGGKQPVIYGNVDALLAEEIVEKHLLKGEIVEEALLEKGFERA